MITFSSPWVQGPNSDECGLFTILVALFTAQRVVLLGCKGWKINCLQAALCERRSLSFSSITPSGISNKNHFERLIKTSSSAGRAMTTERHDTTHGKGLPFQAAAIKYLRYSFRLNKKEVRHFREQANSIQRHSCTPLVHSSGSGQSGNTVDVGGSDNHSVSQLQMCSCR